MSPPIHLLLKFRSSLLFHTHRRSPMPRYVDGFVLPVPKDNIAAYRKIARKAGKIWREHGALEYIECVADDVKPGKHTSFPQSVKLKADEVVVFSWIVYPSRKQRDAINAKVMADPATEVDDGPEEDALRHAAHVLRRLQDAGRALMRRRKAMS